MDRLPGTSTSTVCNHVPTHTQTHTHTHTHTHFVRVRETNEPRANVDGHRQADTRLWLQKHLIRPTKQEESCG